jgi:diadenosine tetraphosphate (Ap4A) HIT family hydrolase
MFKCCMISFVNEAKVDLDRTLRPSGDNVGWNVGLVGGQSVPHIYLHGIARFADEPPAGRGACYQLEHPEHKRP